MTMQDDFEELGRAWADLKHELLTNREFHVYLVTAWLLATGAAIIMEWL